MTEPTLVTLAIPTCRRPQLLRRALASVAVQGHPALEVLVADNASAMPEVRAAVEAFRDRLPGLRLHEHERNIGAVANFFWCLEQARGRYFMWLADDDELAPATLPALVALLDAAPDAVTAVPHWRLLRAPDRGTTIPARGYEHPSALRRALRFGWRATDACFYALHRTEVLRRARRVEYVWPNRGVLSNWAYPYLLDMVLAGRVLAVQVPHAQWINHEYSEKTYRTPGGLGGRLRELARRLNVHALYVARVGGALGIGAAVAMAAVSAASLPAEIGRRLAGRLSRPAGGATEARAP